MDCILMDFDGTLTRRDTTRDLILALLRERPWLVIPALPGVWRMAFSRSAEEIQSAKNRCLGRLLCGLTAERVGRALVRYEFAVGCLLRPELLDLMAKTENSVVIVTASPEFAVRSLFRTDPIKVIGTQFECLDGRYTGKILSPPCYGQHKPHWIGAWLQDQGSVRFIEAWSDSPTDMPMMMLAEKRIWLCSEEIVARVKPIEPADSFWPLTEVATVRAA